MKIYKLVLIGFGNAGQALARLLIEKRSELKDRHSIRFMVTAIATGTHGRALEIMSSGDSLDGLSPSTQRLETGREFMLLNFSFPQQEVRGQPSCRHQLRLTST